MREPQPHQYRASRRRNDNSDEQGAPGAASSSSSMRPEEDDRSYQCSCRYCCSLPHGYLPLLSLSFSLVALILAFIVANSCYYLESNFVYCQEPDASALDALPYAPCGECHCIPEDLDADCPALPPAAVDWDRLSSETALDAFKNLELTNPFSLLCNPYSSTNCTTAPPQMYTELGATAVCAFRYEGTSDLSAECPTRYSMVTYESSEALREADAADPTTVTVPTHWGACGACSTAQDLAAYLEFTDLTSIGTTCTARALLDGLEAGVACYRDKVGLTEACAAIWIYSGFYTNDKCGSVCVRKTVAGLPNNSPAPTCRLQDCLQCDEDMSGPLFKTVAGRSRRRSGLLSMIARPCDSILEVEHAVPCENRDDNDAAEGDAVPSQPRYWKPPPPEPICAYARLNLGIFHYEKFAASKGLFNIDFSLSIFEEDEYDIFKSSYAVCETYSINRSDSGFWSDISSTLGAAWSATNIFTIITIVAGGVCCVVVGCSSCVAYRPRVWKCVGGVFLCCSVMMVLTLLFFSSDVCEDGCKVGRDAILAIVSAVGWLVAGVFALLVPPDNGDSPMVSCCCCPAPMGTEMKRPKSSQYSEEIAPLVLNESFHSAQNSTRDGDDDVHNNNSPQSASDGEEAK